MLIGDLTRNLLVATAEADIHVVTAREEQALVGAIVLSRLTFDQDDRTVFPLGPAGVATDRQGEGIGQMLLAHGIAALRNKGVELAVTYGDRVAILGRGFGPSLKNSHAHRSN